MTNFKAMTWNVENLFRPEPDAGEELKQRTKANSSCLPM
jgi:hypothetical protein